MQREDYEVEAARFDGVFRGWSRFLPREGRSSNVPDPNGKRRLLAWINLLNSQDRLAKMLGDPRCQAPIAPARVRVRFDSGHGRPAPAPRLLRRFFTVSRL